MKNKKYRIEKDSMGEMKVPHDALYGAQTQRSYKNFNIGSEKFPREFIRAYGILKKAAATVNFNFGNLNFYNFFLDFEEFC